MERSLTADPYGHLWSPWTPVEVTQRLRDVTAPWYVAAGWALDLYIGGGAREHADIEIAVPQGSFDEIVAALPGFEWDVVGDGQVWTYPTNATSMHQTWLRDPASGRYRLDVFREPHSSGRWVCRRSAAITLAYDDLILYTGDGVPFVIPEVALLFKAKHLRDKDTADFERVLPVLEHFRLVRLAEWLTEVHPGHPWMGAMQTHLRREE